MQRRTRLNRMTEQELTAEWRRLMGSRRQPANRQVAIGKLVSQGTRPKLTPEEFVARERANANPEEVARLNAEREKHLAECTDLGSNPLNSAIEDLMGGDPVPERQTAEEFAEMQAIEPDAPMRRIDPPTFGVDLAKPGDITAETVEELIVKLDEPEPEPVATPAQAAIDKLKARRSK